MPSISVSHISWCTPEGQPVLTGIDLQFKQERTGIVGRNGVGKSTLLHLLDGTLKPLNGHIILNGTLSGLRQIVRAESDETVADLFGVTQDLALLQKAETGEASMAELEHADWTLESRILSALGRLALDATPATSLALFSGGQRTRLALAAAVFAQPDFLLLDEPTNNLDHDGRRAVLNLLRDWRGGAIIVSHDRELLEEMDAIVELTSIGATRHGGNWSHYRERKAVELAAAQQDLATAERRVKAASRDAQIAVERKQRRDAAGRRKGARGDMPRIVLGMRRERAEKSGGDNAHLADRLRADAEQAARQAKARVEVVEPISIALTPTGLAASQRVLDVESLTVGHERERAIITSLGFSVVGPERISLAGPNGSGKSTLLATITGHLRPWAGDVKLHVPFALLDQQVTLLDPARTIAENFLRFHPGVGNHACRAALAHFRFRADAADQRVATLSGGQMLRAGLACVLGGASPPPLLILDEPTNHLDLEAMEAVEAGLNGYDGALLVVSHDGAFLRAIGIERTIDLAGGTGKAPFPSHVTGGQ